MVQNGPNDHFGQNALIPNWILAFARPKWTKMVHFGPFWPEEVHFGPFRSANRTLAIPENFCRFVRLAKASALYRGQNPQNREKRVSGSKNSHFPSPQKRAL